MLETLEKLHGVGKCSNKIRYQANKQKLIVGWYCQTKGELKGMNIR